MQYTDDLFLTSFAPLLQIWGGICVLFFYHDLFAKSPLKNKWMKSLLGLKECCFSLFTPKYKELLPEEIDPESLSSSIEEKVDSDYTGPLWQIVRRAVYNLAKFGFFHVIILLLYIGFECFSPFKEMYHALLLTNLIAILYIVLNFGLYKKRLIQSDWGLYLFVGLMGAGLIFYPIIYNNCVCFRELTIRVSISRTTVSYLTLVLSTISYLIALLAYIIRGVITISKCNWAIERINRDFEYWTAIPLKKIPLRIRVKLLFPKNDGDYLKKTGRDQIGEYLKEEIKALLTTVRGILGS